MAVECATGAKVKESPKEQRSALSEAIGDHVLPDGQPTGRPSYLRVLGPSVRWGGSPLQAAA